MSDPFGNAAVMLDQSKGGLVTDAAGEVVGVERRVGLSYCESVTVTAPNDGLPLAPDKPPPWKFATK